MKEKRSNSYENLEAGRLRFGRNRGRSPACRV
jgi:hypothetical protein